MYTQLYIYSHIHTHIYIHTYIYIHPQTCISIYSYIYIYYVSIFEAVHNDYELSHLIKCIQYIYNGINTFTHNLIKTMI